MRTLYDHKDILDAVDMWGKLLEARITSLEDLMAKTFAEVLADVVCHGARGAQSGQDVDEPQQLHSKIRVARRP